MAGMPKTPKFRPAKAPEGWRLNIPANLSKSGRRERHFYRTKELALSAAAGLREKLSEFGAQATAISPSLAESATAAQALLAPYGISLLEAAQRVAEEEDRRTRSVTVEQALEQFKLAKATKSDKQVQAIGHMARHLLADFAGRVLSTITAEEITAHLDSRTNGTAAFNGRLRLLVTLWRWSAKPPREWCSADALVHVERKEHVSGEVGVLTADQVESILRAAERHFPECVPAYAAAIYTGLRQAELERLTLADFSVEGIKVPSASAKTKRSRFIQMTPALAAWLERYPVGVNLCPPNWERKSKAIRRIAGFRVWSDLVPEMKLDPPMEATPPEGLPEWPQNAVRHTAASVALALGKSLKTLIFEHGHAGGEELLKSHYIGIMPKEEAGRIDSLRPL
jgi:site-specific recombinase XerD